MSIDLLLSFGFLLTTISLVLANNGRNNKNNAFKLLVYYTMCVMGLLLMIWCAIEKHKVI